MKLLVITFTTDETNPGLFHLVASLKKHGYEYKVLTDGRFSWGGDNFKIIAEWLKENASGYTHILYTDAWDTLAFGPINEKEYNGNYWLFSGEKNPCFAKRLAEYEFNYCESRWKYLCAGGYIAPINLYSEVVGKYPRFEDENDQQWASRIFETKEAICIDGKCEIFQTLYNMDGLHKQPDWGEFAVNKQYEFVNLITATKPAFIHGNGKVDMRSIYHHPYKNY